MLQQTKGIVLRAVKYGETSLVTTIFTEEYGVQTYMVQGVRTSRQSANRAGMFQPGTLLDMVVYQQPLKNMQRIKEFQPSYIYTSVHEQVVKNSVLLFSVELLLRLLPEQAPLPSLFEESYKYFVQLDKLPPHQVANFPLYFIILCSRELGYDLQGTYSQDTPHLNLHEGGYSDKLPATAPYATDDDAKALDKLLRVTDITNIHEAEMGSDMRLRLIDWYIAFLQQYTQHMGSIRSLPILRTILH